MELIVEHAEVWVASVQDKPGAVAGKLSTLAEAGADLGFVIARRAPEKPGTGVVFVTPLRGDEQIAAAAQVGFATTNSLHSVRIEGPNKAGIAAEAEPEWRALLNGKDLTGWQNGAGGKPGGGWGIEDGALVRQRKGGGYIWTKERFGDFVPVTLSRHLISKSLTPSFIWLPLTPQRLNSVSSLTWR